MALELGTYIGDLVPSNPVGTDTRRQGDDHIRLLKDTIKNTFPNVTTEATPVPVTADGTELNYLDGATPGTNVPNKAVVLGPDGSVDRLRVSHDSPELRFIEEDAPTDEGVWRWVGGAGSMLLQTIDDAEAVVDTVLDIRRVGTDVVGWDFKNGAIDAQDGLSINSVPITIGADEINKAVQNDGDTMTGPLTFEGSIPKILLKETDEVANETLWSVSTNLGAFRIVSLDDIESDARLALNVTRSGIEIDSVTFPDATSVNFDVNQIQIGYDVMEAYASELNVLRGVTITTAELNKLDGFTGTSADLNYAKDLRATNVTATEYDYLQNARSNLQVQIDSKANTSHESVAATTSVQGHVVLASGNDAIAGTDGTKAVTPAALDYATKEWKLVRNTTLSGTGDSLTSMATNRDYCILVKDAFSNGDPVAVEASTDNGSTWTVVAASSGGDWDNLDLFSGKLERLGGMDLICSTYVEQMGTAGTKADQEPVNFNSLSRINAIRVFGQNFSAGGTFQVWVK